MDRKFFEENKLIYENNSHPESWLPFLQFFGVRDEQFASRIITLLVVMQGFTLDFRQLLIMQTYVCKISSEAF